jgi:hypothetical protein
MTNFLIGCVLGVFLVVCVGIPFLAPWPMRVRYLVDAQYADPVLGFAPVPRLAIGVVTLTAVRADGGHVDLVVDETGAGVSGHGGRVLSRDACAAAVVARLDGWSALHTALLLIIDEKHRVHLYGPDGSITDLEFVGEKIQ